jgi:hypothetical protein
MTRLTGNQLFLLIMGILAVVPGALWYFTAEPIWALGWVLLIVFGMV